MRRWSPAWLAAGLALLVSAGGARGQGTFQNLNFELGTVVHAPGYPANFYLFAEAFPGWTGHIGGAPMGLTLYNELAMSTAGFSILDRAYPGDYDSTGGVIQGRYTAVLMSGQSGVSQPSDATMRQTGLVPAGTESLRFRAHYEGHESGSSFGVAVGGQTLSLTPVGSGTNYVLYAVDVHTLAGQTAEVAFTVNAYPGQLWADYLFLDSIGFSYEPVPEPGVLGLWALGGVLVGWRVVRRR